MRQNLLSLVFALDVVLLVLLAIASQFVESGTAEYAILQVSLGVILLTIAAVVVAARRGVTLFEH